MRLLKVLLALFAVALLLFGAAVAYLVTSFDAGRLKNEIERAITEKTGRKITIGAKVGLSFYPDLALAIGGVSLSERGRPEQEFAAIEHARVAVRFLPLLSKRVEAEQIELIGLKARIVAGRDGRRNIDDLLGGPVATSPSATPGAPMPRFNIAGLRIEKATITYLDESEKQTFALSDFSMTTGVLANAANGKLAATGKLAGNELQAAFDVRGSYLYDLDARRYGADGLSVSLQGEMAGVKGLDAGLQAASVRVQGTQDMRVDKLSLKVKGQGAGESFEAALELPKLLMNPDKASGETLKLEVRLAGKAGPLLLSLQAADVQGSGKALQIGRLALKAEGKRGDTTLNAQLTGAVRANLVAKAGEVAKLSGEIELGHPAMPMKRAKFALGGHLRADWAKTLAVAGDTTLKIDESTLQAKWDVARFAPLSLGFDLALDRLDIDRYFPPKPKSGTADEARKTAPGGAAAPIDLKALQGIEAHGGIRIGALQVARVKLANLKAGLRLQGGRLNVTDYSASLYGGRVSGSASVDSRNNHVAIKQTLESIDINPLMRDAVDKDLLEGSGNVSLDLDTSGATVIAMKRGLAGSAALSLRDGAIKGINLAKSFRELKARLGARQDAVQKAAQAEKTDFSELSATFRIANGVAHSDDLAAKSPFLRLAGAGDIDVGASSINYLAKATVVNTSGGQAGKELDHVKGMTIPVRLTGPFDNLAYRIEFGSLVEEAVKAQVKEKVQEKIEGKLGDKLKGLFRK